VRFSHALARTRAMKHGSRRGRSPAPTPDGSG
jgi:hypothetical protein